MDNTPPEPFDGLTAQEDVPEGGLTADKLHAICDQFSAEQLEHDKRFIEALYASGFRIMVGGSRNDLPVAILPSSMARAHAEVDLERRNRDPAENFYRDNLGIFNLKGMS